MSGCQGLNSLHASSLCHVLLIFELRDLLVQHLDLALLLLHSALGLDEQPLQLRDFTLQARDLFFEVRVLCPEALSSVAAFGELRIFAVEHLAKLRGLRTGCVKFRR